MDKKENLLM